jgi:cell division protease FtsH
VSTGIDSELMAASTPGFSGADLFSMINTAALIAANRGAQFVVQSDFEEARDKVMMGA